ncbi:exodeoxyribonuclease V subunit alpha [Psychrobacter sp. DAB_AL32B]|uniref:exodeoxyribonuclease V subunit alpha n=1 Tax=Psychrobacter sp. DAB_AL32B TaxID=1028414 RepID=UPI000B7CE853|nr:exodeoxyribonuclease V subunit alpha [Psychrobacter sp. DAB_AL32B]OXL24822.1 exodeoxyribonuclease V subunit alpha [Psychrobacter sp. DAB_AL32B]
MSDVKSINSVIQQQKANSGGINATSTDAANNWSTTISQYLLQRRAQTAVAYQGQLAPNTGEEVHDTQAWLFEALFEVLVQRLEEGHTVLVLDASNGVVSDNRLNDDTGLFIWQQHLLQPLLQPLFTALISTGITDLSIAGLLESNEMWHAAMRQSTLPLYDKKILEQRRQVCVNLYQSLRHIASNATSIENSLSSFNEILNDQPLFTRIGKVKNEIACPIIFQVDSNLGYEGERGEKGNEATKITLWLHRTWQAEHALAKNVIRIKNQTLIELPIAPNPRLHIEQQDAIHMANRSAFSIITGGPGTGKTFTVAQLVMALQQEQSEGHKSKVNLALAAPTGKAAQRMQESLQDAIQQAGVSIQLPEAKTIHRLLGIGQGGRPRYNDKNPLSEDIIIVDEASMLGVELANHLVSAIKANARLILLGDANQLAAVDAGAVLADLYRIPVLQDVHKKLVASRRFKDDSGIGKLAKLINNEDEGLSSTQNMIDVWQLLQDDDALNFYHLASSAKENTDGGITINKIQNSLSNYNFLKNLSENYLQYFNQTKKILTKIKLASSMPIKESINDFTELMIILNQFRVLTAGHHGRCGDNHINSYLSEQHKTQLKLPLSKSPWYHGRPVMVLQNNYELGLFNGDIGICLQTEKGRLQVFFENKTQGININMLSDEMIATAYAMTIHKSQGSEFDHVAISFDDNNTRLLSQELIYTAVTRAKKQVSIFSTTSAFTRALSTPTERQTGLSLQFERLIDKY